MSALGACGDATSVAVLRPFAASGESNNSLTSISVTALLKIAARHAEARRGAADVLRVSFPPPVGGRLAIMCQQLAEQVHKGLEQITGTRLPFPPVYNEMTRRQLMMAWSKVLAAMTAP